MGSLPPSRLTADAETASSCAPTHHDESAPIGMKSSHASSCSQNHIVTHHCYWASIATFTRAFWASVGGRLAMACDVSVLSVVIRCLSSPFLTPSSTRRRPTAGGRRRRSGARYGSALPTSAVSTTTPSNLCVSLLDNIFASSLYIPRPLGSRHQFYPHTEDLSLGVWFLNASPPVIRDALAKRSFQWLASSRFSMLCAVRKGMCGASAMGHGSLNGSTHWPS